MVQLGQNFEVGAIQKTYKAVVWDNLPNDSGIINTLVDEKTALTNYVVTRSINHSKLGRLSEVRLELKTGRTHQLRKHLSGIGNDILGDLVYGKSERPKVRGLWLWATEIKFLHPIIEEPIHFKLGMINKVERLFK